MYSSGCKELAGAVGEMSASTRVLMQHLCVDRRVPSLAISTLRRSRTNDTIMMSSALFQYRRQHDVPVIPKSSEGESISDSVPRDKWEGIPKRIYQGAPKRQHGQHAGWRKFGKPKDGPWREKQLALSEAAERSRTRELREVSTSLKEIRVSPWNLNLLTKVVRDLPVVDAISQMEFCKKKHTVTVQRIIKNACNLADIRYGMVPEQLKVAEIYVTKGKMQKYMRIMGRGRVGIGHKKWSHLNLTLKEIDFAQEIRSADTKSRMNKLQARQVQVEELVRAAQEADGEAEPLSVSSTQ